MGKKDGEVGEVYLMKTELKMESSTYAMVRIENEPAEVKETSSVIAKKNKKWEHEVVWFLVDDVNKAAAFLEKMNQNANTEEAQQERI